MRSNVAAIRKLIYDFPWFHRWVGAVGNTLFFIGSVFFLFEELLMPATWIFIIGSFGMMLDSFGEKLYRYEETRDSAGEPAGR